MSPSTEPRDFLLDIEGMTCASCVTRLEQVLGKRPEVSEARVSLASRTAVVRATVEGPSTLIDAIEDAGYGARIHRDAAPAGDPARPYYVRLAVAAFLSFETIIFSLVAAQGTRFALLASWVCSTPVLFYCGWPFLRAAARAGAQRTWTMDTLVAAGALAAYGYSAGSAIGGHDHAYFDTAAMIITLILAGRVVEAKARMKAGDAARRMLERRPLTATVIEGGEETTIDSASLEAGMRVAVRPGERVPADGTVASGRSSLDVSMVTGESLPVDVGPGDEVIGGCVNGPGRIEVDVVRVGAETKLAQIVRLLETTQASKAPIQRVADRIAAVFVPRVIAVAGATFFAMWFFGARELGVSLMRASAVMLVACPCSLGLAVPVAIMAGSGRAAERGILFKGGEVFEAAKKVDTVLIDKTGTLTRGTMELSAVVPFGMGADELLGLAAAVERGSEHPIARCVVAAAAERDVPLSDAQDHLAQAGTGVVAVVAGARVSVGRPIGLPSSAEAEAASLAAAGLTVFAVHRAGGLCGLLGVSDTVKEDAREAVARLQSAGIDVAVVSGDRRASAEAAAREAGIERVVAEVYPEGKVEEVRRLQAIGRTVAFVGDGINDAPALAQADVGIALGTGTDVAKEAGNVLIVGGELRRVVEGLDVARKTFNVIGQNLVWAFGYNALMIPLAIAGRVSPVVAAAAMAGSSVTVISNALRLRLAVRPRGEGWAAQPEATESSEDLDHEPERSPGSVSPDGSTRAVPTDRLAQEAEVEPGNALPLGRFARAEGALIARGLFRLMARSWEY